MVKQVVVEERVVGESLRSVGSALAVGAGVGFGGWLLALAVKYGLINAVFCRSADVSSVCQNSDSIAWGVAFVAVSLLGMFALVRSGVFRPLLVVIASVVSLWMIGLWFFGAAWWVGLLWSAILFALAYALFAWLASLSRFTVSLVLIIVTVVLARLLISA